MTCLSGEIHLRKGTPGIKVDPSTGLYEGVAYAAQLPWLQHASIKNVSSLSHSLFYPHRNRLELIESFSNQRHI
jgi:hypothetical protein